MLTWTPLLFLGLFFAVQSSPVAALAILGCWLAWELKSWGGADAVAAITLLLVYPETHFLLAFLFVHVVMVVALWIGSLLNGKKLRMHRVPGLPLLGLSLLFIPVLQQIPGFQ